MEGSKLGLYVTRAFQLIFAIIVLGVSAHLAAEINGACDEYRSRYCDRILGRLPESSAYAAFSGAFGTLGAIVGLVAAFITSIPWFVALVFDALATIFYLAGGIILCAIVVIGLSVAWIKFIHYILDVLRQEYAVDESVFKPFLSALKFDLVAGVFALIDAALAIAASLWTVIPCLVCVVVDGFCALFLLAGGLATVVILKRDNINGVGACDAVEGDFKSLCTKLHADAAFLIIGFFTTLIAAALFFITRRTKQSNVARYPAIQHGVEL
ncbi:hypothetical protein M409DRAFT_29527 [Zasmidium cellare ATCC 36951]|uniref:MARVEL domain-containing protein n=1 Tax=Zasmidium cellare ATCC 36951 TaxID=1080233 RepID=A0A6A6C0X3_ZASCE|nr:uncharacterized protein M409DRAFT_29527 [Zasmidium cellare ATCC 36951]KAF2159918.1 hypothetical protein M409DRAFT_29527 [Zasmidium cellare ATCC 36951]